MTTMKTINSGDKDDNDDNEGDGDCIIHLCNVFKW